ncbi:MAG TPA: hypothetical protein VNT32_15565 [Thermoleophilaceae bacterium]|nr:hypothetical protein [Thermoleophilaceae bacterium]
MATARNTLTVPAEYVEDFRQAIVEEIAFETKAIAETRRDLDEHRERKDELAAEVSSADMESAMGYLERVAALLPATADGAVELDADPVVLSHTLATMMARGIIGPRLTGLLEVVPLEGESVAKVLAEWDRLYWALEEGEFFHELAMAELAERGA